MDRTWSEDAQSEEDLTIQRKVKIGRHEDQCVKRKQKN